VCLSADGYVQRDDRSSTCFFTARHARPDGANQLRTGRTWRSEPLRGLVDSVSLMTLPRGNRSGHRSRTASTGWLGLSLALGPQVVTAASLGRSGAPWQQPC